MSDTVERAEAHLEERIDELATRLVVEGAGGEFLTALAQLSQTAGASGYPETARIASELAGRLGPQGAGAPADSLSAEISRLHDALQAEAHRPRAGTGETAPPPAAPGVLAEDPALVNDFVLESNEHLASIESRMLVLEQNPADMDAIHSVFRGFHTIKGLAGFLEFADIQEVAHEVETLLDRARNSTLAITPGVVDVVLAGGDYLKQAIAAVKAALEGGTAQPPAERSGLIRRIRAVQSGEPAPAAEAPPAAPADPPVAAADAAAPAREGRGPGTAGASSVRVETGKLDYLMDMVGEMVIAQSLVRHNPALSAMPDSRLQRDLSQLARITGEVQKTAMQMRMVPIGQLFQRTARLVRDLARKAGKRVELEMRGEETELDKTIAEELADPLLHMVRNSIDHGIETPDERVAAGKNPIARVGLEAYHQAGQIVVEIADDGRGLDRGKILKKARQKGLIPEGGQLAETEIFHLIFEPGFSTAERVTNISGRGVGMDVVRRHIQKLRGRIDIQSPVGRGTTFYLRLPLTLAIIEGLVVVVGAHRYVIPIFAVREMFRPTPEALATVPGRHEMALVRGRLLPVVRLSERFGIAARAEDPCRGLLVVAESEGKQFGILVDDLLGKQEVVIKSLGESLKNIAGIAGAAILGDGRIGLILDVDGVFRGGNGKR